MNDSSPRPSVAKRDWTLTRQAFDQFLRRLGPDPTQAWKRYEKIRGRLIKYFQFHGAASSADALADETIDRVAGKFVDEIEIQNIEAYAMGVARYVIHEYWRSKEAKTISIGDLSPDGLLVEQSPEAKIIQVETERQEKIWLECMRKCLNKLPLNNCDLLLQYQTGIKSERIQNRKVLAEEMGITQLALRLRVHQIRTKLRKCVNRCVNQ